MLYKAQIEVQVARSGRKLGVANDLSCPQTASVRLTESCGAAFLVIDRVDTLDYVFGVRSHTGEVSSVYLTNDDIEKLVEFLSRKGN